MANDWLEWHRPYDDPDSSLRQRLAVVQRHLAGALDLCPAGPIRLVSVCAGQGRDLFGALAAHRRRDDVIARLVELDERNVRHAEDAAGALGLDNIEIVCGDASNTNAYVGSVPADIVLVCGVFGNITDDDIRGTIDELPGLCAPRAVVIWTRYPREPGLLPWIDDCFQSCGFELLALETGEDGRHFGVGVHRLIAEPRPFRPDVRLFSFLEQPTPARPDRGQTRRSR